MPSLKNSFVVKEKRLMIFLVLTCLAFAGIYTYFGVVAVCMRNEFYIFRIVVCVVNMT